MKVIIFTDLDGTLLDTKTYSFEKALPALELIKKSETPLVFCTSKTRAETELYRRKLGNEDPFIVENGGAIFIPKNYFPFEIKYDKVDGEYFVIKLGTEYEKLREVLESIKNRGIRIVGFADMSPGEIHEHCGIPLDQAELAKKREYDEAFKPVNEEDEKEVSMIIKQNGLNFVKGGICFHITGKNDKGKAVRILADLYRKKYDKIITCGLGDSENDFKMLEFVDRPYLIQKPDGSFASEKFEKVEGVGPEGWNKAISILFK
ncbi:MAG: mannosyl-3-phosphoglycerate phosphatase [Candidatus Aenigmarchaeota archaeon]